MIEKLKKCDLFCALSSSQIEKFLSCCDAKTKNYKKDHIIFYINDIPQKLYILIEGKVNICNDDYNGKRKVIANISNPGDLFGEVFLFLNKNSYDNYTVTTENSTILEIPKNYLYSSCSNTCDFHSQIISNMMSIFARKAYYLNQKLNILSSSSLRQKICKLFLLNCSDDGIVKLNMNREDLADFLSVARPSLSRELMKMKKENIIKLEKKSIYINDFKKIKEYL